MSLLSKYSLKLGSFNLLEKPSNMQENIEKYNILLCADFSPASGNLIQCTRLKKALNSSNFNVLLRNIYINDHDSSSENEIEDLERFIKQQKIHCILCMNVWKNARFFYKIMKKQEISLKIPIIIIIAGTDANVAINVTKYLKFYI